MIKSDYDPHQWSLTVDIQNIEYGVKFRTGHDWANRWCAAVKDDFPYGTALFNPVSDDNILISSVGSYIVRFNDLTGSYYIGLKN